MIIKKFTSDLIPQIAKLCRLSMHLDIMPDFLLKEKIIDDADFNSDFIECAFDNENLVGFFMGVIRKRNEESFAYIKLICIHPNFRRKGIASHLYNNFEAEISKFGIKKIRVYECFPNYFMPGIDPFYTEAICFFERNGFRKFGDTSNLVCNLLNQKFSSDKEEAELKHENIFCNRANLSDKEKVFSWLNNLFPAWIDEVNQAFLNNPVSVFLAKKDKELIAFSAYEGNNKGTGWFGPMGTDPIYRGKQIGSILLKKCLASMKEIGYSKAIIPWVGPIPFYMYYANAYVQRVFWRYEKILP